MKIKLDENMPASLRDLLVSLGHDTDTVITENLSGNNDDVIWRAAQEAGRMLITQDLDFSDIREFAPGTHHGLVLFRLLEPGWPALLSRARSVFSATPIERWRGSFVVITQSKVRVRDPDGTESE